MERHKGRGLRGSPDNSWATPAESGDTRHSPGTWGPPGSSPRSPGSHHAHGAGPTAACATAGLTLRPSPPRAPRSCCEQPSAWPSHCPNSVRPKGPA